MTDIPANGEKQKLVNSAVLTVIARLAMVFAAGAAPVGGWMLQRAITSVDEVARKIDAARDLALETGVNVKLIQQTQQIQGAVLADHETRVRILEGRPITAK